jgi:dTDP-4-amino-4,6-dideoxygalactose transaminase
MLVTDDEVIAQKIRLLRSHAMTTLTWDRHQGHAWSYDVVDLGFNYRLDELRAALGRVQLRKLPGNNQRRQALTARYHEMLSQKTPEITIPFKTYRGLSSCHLLPVLLPEGKNRVNFMEGMKGLGIQTSVHYPPIHLFPYYEREEPSSPTASLPVTEKIAVREVTLPLYANLSVDDVDLVVRSVREVLDGI